MATTRAKPTAKPKPKPKRKRRRGKLVARKSSTFVRKDVPKDEAWLHENPASLASVVRGLKQLRDGAYVRPRPDLTAAKELADQIDDD